MATEGTVRRRAGILGASLLAAVAISGCATEAPVTGPDVAAAAQPVFQTAISARFDLNNGVGLGSDISSDGITGVYRDTVCGVAARVFQAGTVYVDGNMQLDNSRAADRTCQSLPGGTYPRKLTIRYPDTNVQQVYTGGINVDDMGSVLVGAPALRPMGVRIAGPGARCASLDFGRTTTGSKVLVTRLTATSWSIASQASNTVACVQAKGATTFISNFTVAFNVTLN